MERRAPTVNGRTAEDGDRLDAAAAAPLYQQLFASLKRRILAGEFDPDGLLPSEARIERAYGVSRITVRRALQELEQQGLVLRRQGRPTRVLASRPPEPGAADLETELADMLTVNFKSDAELLDFKAIPAPYDVAKKLELSAGAPVLCSLRLRRMAGRPFSRSLAYVPQAFAEGLTREELEAMPLLLLLLRDGLAIDGLEQSIGAVAADRALAELLEVPEGAPLLHVERLFRDKRQRAVELVSSHFRADLYRYRSSFRTAPAADARRPAPRPPGDRPR